MGPLKLPEVVRALKHWIGASDMLPRESDIDALVSRRGQGSMLFDHYSPQDVLEALERYSVSPKLRSRGFERLAVALETLDPERQTVRLTAERGRRSMLLGECILRDDDFTTSEQFATALHGLELHMLIVQWIRLQDPTRSFTPARAALPGQDHPSCGVGHEVMDMLLGLSARLGFAGIMVCPEFAHNAVIYSKQFRFFDPASQGRFEALAGCMQGLSLAEFAWAVHLGCVRDEIEDRTFRWFHEEMVRPTDETLARYLSSDDYLRRASRSRAASSLSLDRERLASLEPLDPDGSPRIEA